MTSVPRVLQTVLVEAQPLFAGGEAFDLVALASIQQEFTTQSADEAWLSASISRMSEAARRFCNRTFQIRRYRERIWPFRDAFPMQLPANLQSLQLMQWPVSAEPSPTHIAPPCGPSLSAVAGGAGPAQVLYARISYVTDLGETAASLETRFLVPANNVLSIAAPGLDRYGQAVGWNCYVGTAPDTETLQNEEPIAVSAAFTLSGAPQINGVVLPDYTLVVEHATQPVPLAEDVDFIINRKTGQIERLSAIDHYTRGWPVLPITVEYSAGFSAIPGDIQDALIQWVKLKYFARDRDPAVRETNVEGVYSAIYWFGTGPGGSADMPNFVEDTLTRYRMPMVA